MDKIRYGKWCNWAVLSMVLLHLLAVFSAQPEGFLSIKCGGKTNHTDENNITWVTDAAYIADIGETADIGNASEEAWGSPLDSLRFFPKPLEKSCYQLPVPSNVPYLLRVWFITGNYSRFHNSLSFDVSVETVDMLATESVKPFSDGGSSGERILVTSGTVMYVCLIRTFESDDPFISGIELRPLRDGMYAQAKPGTMLLSRDRIDAGGIKSTLRYPQDTFDRIWTSDLFIDVKEKNIFLPISASNIKEPISTQNTKELPPTAVMQTAWLLNDSDGRYIQDIGLKPGSDSLLLLYFAEVQTLKMSESRSFYFQLIGETQPQNITLVQNYSAIELIFVSNEANEFRLWPAPNSTNLPIINAYECYNLIHSELATYSQDIDALDSLQRKYGIKDWISDPCYLKEWDGIGCRKSSSGMRISKIDLSGRNLTGLMANDIAQLTALVTVSLDNNHLMGSLPNLSNLTLLERLYLQNNNLSGTVPEWLSELKSLKELNIENNSFSGVIPAKLLLNCSLKLNYYGNPRLSMNKRDCSSQNSKNNKLKVVLGITISGILVITLALIMAIVAYRNKFSKKEDGVATEISRVEKERKPFLHEDPRIMVPTTTKCRAFTLDEITAATQNFSQEIGRGGFGSVFFGKLPDGKEIAVKVLSLYSHQGVGEFLNEVDLLSRIHHRNLLSLLGYCNDTREVMLIYEHMSRGSLKDHLYGASAENSELNWKTRLKIALDAAQGLEYLHVGCTPKIIHRDIKTSNILLDNNFNGKLADFGLSRMTIDEQATHVTTAVKGTFGYLDPEYYNTQMLTEKSDVYSFGVVLLEMICGRAPIDLKVAEEDVNIIRWATPYILKIDDNAAIVTEIIDQRLSGNYELKSITLAVKVAMRCVQSERSCRPSMSEVVADLKAALKYEDLLADMVDSSEVREGMEWSDDNSNIAKVGSDIARSGFME